MKRLKRFKKVFTVALALMMLMTMVMAFPVVASADDTGSITITQPVSNTVSNAGQTFGVYRVLDATANGDYSSFSYKVNANFADFFGEDAGTTVTSTGFDAIVDSYGGIDLFAKALMEYVDDNHITADRTGAGLATASTVIDDLPLGYYLVTGSVTSQDDSATTITAACSLTTTDPDVTIHPKADAPTIDKKVWNHNISDADKWSDWTDVNIGDVVDFQLTSMVPENLVGYEHYLFAIHDKMSAGLSFDKDSVVVTIGGSEVAADYYTVDGAPAADGDTFDIVFKSAYFVDLINGDDRGAEILVNYSATLNSGAVIGYDGNPNEVMLEYSNNPYDTGSGTPGDKGDTGKTPWHKVVVYTYEINVFKFTGAMTLADGLAGAGFELRATADGAAITFSGSNGEYTKDPNASVTTLVSPANGQIKLKGLDAGTYYLVETVVPEGYNGLDGAVTIVITHHNPNTTTGYFAVDKYQSVDETYDAVPVLNQSGGVFPGTGGIGRTIFMVVGLLLMIGALSLVFIRRRVKE